MNNKLFNVYSVVENGYQEFKKGYYSDKTKQFYDFRTSSDINQTLKDLPTLDEVKKCWPNFVGWGTGMEDNNITASYMLWSAMSEYRLNKKENYLKDIHDFVKGLLLNAEVSSQNGFLLRNVHHEDCKTHYINSSRDQYTYWIYFMHKFMVSEFATEDEKNRVASAFVRFAQKAKKDVTPENNYCLTKEDGTPAVASSMLRDVSPAEALRLPMIYLAAYVVSKDIEWLDEYKKYRDETLSYSETVDVSIYKQHIIAPMQMMLSVRFLYDHEEEAEYKNRYHNLMHKVAHDIVPLVNRAFERIDEFNEYNEKIHYIKPFRQNKCVNVGRLWEYGYDLFAYFNVPSTYKNDLDIPPRVLAEGIMIQALCPEYEMPEDQLDKFIYTLTKIKLDDAAFYYPSYYIACYWLLRNR